MYPVIVIVWIVDIFKWCCYWLSFQSYSRQVRGHHIADLDPLMLESMRYEFVPPELMIDNYGLSTYWFYSEVCFRSVTMIGSHCNYQITTRRNQLIPDERSYRYLVMRVKTDCCRIRKKKRTTQTRFTEYFLNPFATDVIGTNQNLLRFLICWLDKRVLLVFVFIYFGLSNCIIDRSIDWLMNFHENLLLRIDLYSVELVFSIYIQSLLFWYESICNSIGEADLDRVFTLPESTFIGGGQKELPLREIIKRLQAAYCGVTGVEYMFINNKDQQEWLRQQFETPGVTELAPEDKKTLLKRLIRSSGYVFFSFKGWFLFSVQAEKIVHTMPSFSQNCFILCALMRRMDDWIVDLLYLTTLFN